VKQISHLLLWYREKFWQRGRQRFIFIRALQHRYLS